MVNVVTSIMLTPRAVSDAVRRGTAVAIQPKGSKSDDDDEDEDNGVMVAAIIELLGWLKMDGESVSH